MHSRKKKVTCVAWIDLQRAFDRVWIDGLITKLMRTGDANNMLKWIQSYLFFFTGEHESVLINSTVARSFYAKVSLKAVYFPRPSS